MHRSQDGFSVKGLTTTPLSGRPGPDPSSDSALPKRVGATHPTDLFSALSAVLFHTQRATPVVRALCAAHASDHWSRYAVFLKPGPTTLRETFCTQIRAGNPEPSQLRAIIAMAADLFKCQITVYKEDYFEVFTGGESEKISLLQMNINGLPAFLSSKNLPRRPAPQAAPCDEPRQRGPQQQTLRRGLIAPHMQAQRPAALPLPAPASRPVVNTVVPLPRSEEARGLELQLQHDTACPNGSAWTAQQLVALRPSSTPSSAAGERRVSWIQVRKSHS